MEVPDSREPIPGLALPRERGPKVNSQESREPQCLYPREESEPGRSKAGGESVAFASETSRCWDRLLSIHPGAVGSVGLPIDHVGSLPIPEFPPFWAQGKHFCK